MVGTMVGGAIVLRTPMLFALGFIVQFLVGGLSGIYVASPPLDYHVHDSYFVVAHFHYTLLAGSVFGLFAGVYYWWPKVTGRLLFERLGRVHFWLFVVGTNLTFIPQFVLGYDGMPRRVADYSPAYGWAGWNTASTVGAGIVALSVLVFLVNVALTSIAGRPGRPRSVGGPHARVGDDLAAAAPQLHRRAARPSARTRRCSTCARRRSCEERRARCWPGPRCWRRWPRCSRCGPATSSPSRCCPGAVLVVLVVALAAARARDPRERLVPEASASGPLAAGGLALLALGAVAGLWAALIGAGLLVLAIVAAVRERWG